ncbi:MAG: oxaloacetate decarboxylase subunit alpha, partial [Pyramidobacter sp.]|nr:oxaloacetate decarboxylase subunit alpha [Pyramidobacter sp.]
MAFWKKEAPAPAAAGGWKSEWASNTPVKLSSCDFRDGQQSLLATRMKTEDMIPVMKAMDDFGFACLEVWGGATFDACIRYLDEDPWERLRT